MSRYTLEEEEQLAELKAFWSKYGNFILIILIIGFGAFAVKNGWHYWKARESANAVKGFESLQVAVEQKNMDLVKKVEQELVNKDGSSPYAERGAMMAAKAAYQTGDKQFAAAQLQWVVDHGAQDEYVATARLLLSGILVEDGKYDQAKALVTDKQYPGFEGLFLDRLGDIDVAQKKYVSAEKSYKDALNKLKDQDPWKQVVQRKLAALPKSGA